MATQLSNSKFPIYVPEKAEGIQHPIRDRSLELNGYAEAKKGGTRMS